MLGIYSDVTGKAVAIYHFVTTDKPDPCPQNKSVQKKKKIKVITRVAPKPNCLK